MVQFFKVYGKIIKYKVKVRYILIGIKNKFIKMFNMQMEILGFFDVFWYFYYLFIYLICLYLSIFLLYFFLSEWQNDLYSACALIYFIMLINNFLC